MKKPDSALPSPAPEGGLMRIPRAGTIADAVQERLSAAILSEQFQAGDKLVETKLANQLGVSRGPIRDALRRLEQVGLVEIRPYQGTFVAELTDRDVLELYAVRAPLEGMAARILAERTLGQDITRLASIVEEMRQVSIHSQLIELDLAFHTELIQATGHRLLNEVWTVIDARLRKFLLLKPTRLYDTPQAAYSIHKAVIDAIRSGDPEGAERVTRDHILAARRSAGSGKLPAATSHRPKATAR